MNALFNRQTARIAAFTLATGISSLSYAQGKTAPAAQEPETYASLVKKIDAISANQGLLRMKERSQKSLPTQENADAIKELKSTLARDAKTVAPTIILTPGISNDDVKSLIQRYDSKVGSTPDYLTAVAKDTASLQLCQENLLADNTPRNEAAAQSISECTSSHIQMGSPQKSAPVADHKAEAAAAAAALGLPAPKPSAPTVVPAPVTNAEKPEPTPEDAVIPPPVAPIEKPVAKAAETPETVPNPVVPAAPEAQPVQPKAETAATGEVTASATSSLPFGLSLPAVIGLGAGGGVLVVGFGLVAIGRRGGKTQTTPAPTVETPKSVPAPVPAPAATSQTAPKKDKKDDNFTL